jgi:hypothetical protein
MSSRSLPSKPIAASLTALLWSLPVFALLEQLQFQVPFPQFWPVLAVVLLRYVISYLP